MAGTHSVFFPDFEKQDAVAFKSQRASKVTIVGVGQVGMACAYSILTQNIAKEIVLADVMREKLEGEVLDLQHAGNFLPAKITAASPDYRETAGSDIIIITAGVRQREGESRLQLMGRNVDVLKGMVPTLVSLSPETIFLVVTNPCDALSYITYKLSGLPPHRVIGSGTFLDSSRFRTLLAQRFEVNPQSVHGWILGEHGDSSVAVWSTVNIGGVPIAQMIGAGDETQEELNKIHQKVISAAGEVIKLKGYTNWAIGAAVSSIVRCILSDERRVMPLSTLATGRYGITEDIYIALPCVLGRHGIVHTLNVPLNPEEVAKLQKSAKTLNDVKVI